MSEYFRKLVVSRDPPPAATIRFRCAKLHRSTVPGSDSGGNAEYNTIYDVLRSRGWKETDVDSDWNIFWADKDWIHDSFDKMHLDPHQHVNHFRNHYELTRKDLLAKNMKRMRRWHEKEGRMDEAQKYNVCPLTFVVPQEYSMFVEEFKKHLGATWIMKPVGRSQGAGIFLVNKLAQIQQWKPSMNWTQQSNNRKEVNADEETEAGPELYVCQKYVEGPLLIGGKKFDIRLYALVVSYQPLVVYMHRGGFCRFSMSRYSSDKSEMNNLGQHLTNVAVQKHSGKAAYRRTGAKWDVSLLKRYLLSTVGRDTVNRLFSDIESIVINSLLAVQKVMINDKHCFELYGYDILIDVDYTPWLLEVNASPSLTANTISDYEMKFGMLDDVLTIIDVERYLSGQELQVGGFDLLYKDGYRFGPMDKCEMSSFVGCANNRLAHLERLAQARAWESSQEARRAENVQPVPGDDNPGRSGGPSERGPSTSASAATPGDLFAAAAAEGRSCRPYPNVVVGGSGVAK